MSFPNTPSWIKLSQASDSDLHRMQREHKAFLGTVDAILGKMRGRLKALTSEISKRDEIAKKRQSSRGERKQLIVTDHALVRYLERKHGIDLDEVVAEIRANIGNGEQYMNGALTIHEDMVYIRRSPETDAEAISTIVPVAYLKDDDAKLAGELLARDKKAHADD
jgi:hypothetical protein